jgi:hypothetical protein
MPAQTNLSIAAAHEQAVRQFEQFCQRYGVRRVRCRLVLLGEVRDTYGDTSAPRRALMAIQEAHPAIKPKVVQVQYRDGIMTVIAQDHLTRRIAEYYIAELF